jgi:hypothetical protein
MPIGEPSRRRFIGLSIAAAASAALATPALASSGLATLARSELARAGSSVTKRDVVGVTDFSGPSRAPRLYLVDMASGAATSLLVAHGRGSDPQHSGWVRSFSNAFGSNASSEGAYVTGDYYTGQHGRSMRLRGLDASNSNAEARALVVHSAWYVGPEIIREHGMLGRSEGCFAVSAADLDQVLTRLGPGRLLVAGKFQAAA